MLPFPPFQPFRQVTSGLIASLPLSLSLSISVRDTSEMAKRFSKEFNVATSIRRKRAFLRFRIPWRCKKPRLENRVLDRGQRRRDCCTSPFIRVAMVERERGRRRKRGEKGKGFVRALFFAFVESFRILGGLEIFLVGRKDKQSARKEQQGGRGHGSIPLHRVR